MRERGEMKRFLGGFDTLRSAKKAKAKERVCRRFCINSSTAHFAKRHFRSSTLTPCVETDESRGKQIRNKHTSFFHSALDVLSARKS
jgi:hypothetical protein